MYHLFMYNIFLIYVKYMYNKGLISRCDESLLPNLKHKTVMHIASAFNSPIISFWGCTKPSLGFSPYMPNKASKNIITPISIRPCSKHGKYCRQNAKGCIKKISSELIYNSVIELLKKV